MKWVAVLVLVSACVADVGTDHVPPQNPIPPSGEDLGSGSGAGGSQTELTATGYLTEIAMIYCDQAFACRATYPFDSATVEASWAGSVSACVARLQTGWGSDQIELEIAKGRIDFDGTAAVDCLGGVAFGACDKQWTDGIQWAESCYHVMNGNVQPGGSCDSVYACASGTCDLTQHVCM